MSKKAPTALAVLLAVPLAACVSVPDTDPGQIVAFNGNTVTIRGGIPAGFEATARPSTGMIATAQNTCPGATYAGAALVDNQYDILFDYLFIC